MSTGLRLLQRLLPSGRASPATRRTVAEAVAASSYDYVIVGAGSAGCLLANRLSADPKNRVLLVEAGGNDRQMWIHIPVGYLYTMHDPNSAWGYHTEKQPGLNGRSISYPRGKVLGGCSSINGMIYQRGQENDYDLWEHEYGCSGWGYASIEKYFNGMLDYHCKLDRPDSKLANLPDEKIENTKRWRVEPPRVRWDVLDCFIEGAKELGIPEIQEFHKSDVESCGYFQVNQNMGVRLSSYRAFVHPIEHRENLTVVCGAHVCGLELSKEGSGDSNDLKCDGVILADSMSKGSTDVLRANREVILSAGSIGSTQILQLSGVGDADHLRNVSVSPLHHLPAVGSNLHDHLQIRSVFKLNRKGVWTLNQAASNIFGQAKMAMEYGLRGTGPLSMAPSQVGMFARSNARYETPNIQYHVQPLSLDRFGEPLHDFPGMTLSVCNLRPTSRGAVRLRDNNPLTPPIIDPNYLDTDEDRLVAAESLRHARMMMETEALSELEPEEIFPGSHLSSDEDLAASAGDISASIFHPVGTCKMGPAGDIDSVVDDQLRVQGVKGLRIVDASIMPAIPSGNTNSPVLMIAEKAADMLLENDQKY